MTDVLHHEWPDALFDRVSGTRAIPGHRVQLVLDSREHEPCTLALIARARTHIHIEHYLAESDAWSQALLSALCQRAREGIQVRVLLDFMGSWRLGWRWGRTLRAAGGELRWFNVPGLGEPLSWVVRNHRKLISIDGTDALMGGWCLSARWRGSRPEDPWRDTGVLVSGPVVSIAEEAFAATWQMTGGPFSATDTIPLPATHTECIDYHCHADVKVRLLAGRPQSSPLFALEQLAMASARDTIWITDAYPVGTPAWLDSLRRAAADGVDVRLLVPGSTDLPLLGMLSRSSYRALLEAGIRVFEWNGGMLHAKSLVIDGYWSRIGSSNSNPASWLGNYELDVVIEDASFADMMQSRYLIDLDHATEIVLRADKAVRAVPPARPPEHRRNPLIRQVRQARINTKTPIRVSRSLALAVREARALPPSEAGLLGLAGAIGLVIAVIGFALPELLATVVAVLSGLVSINLLRIALRRYRQYRLRTAGQDKRSASSTSPE